jgi:hypothetical protein
VNYYKKKEAPTHMQHVLKSMILLAISVFYPCYFSNVVETETVLKRMVGPTQCSLCDNKESVSHIFLVQLPYRCGID